jgi:general secretion pathway protein M
MKEYWIKFKEWHAALEERERRMVNIGGVLLVLAIFYFGLWSPFLTHVDDLRARIGSEQKTLAWMQDADKKISSFAGATGGARQAASPVTMLALLQSKINQAGLKESLHDMKQAANDSIQLQFKKVSFDQLMTLLIAVLKANHVSISQFNAVAEGSPGMVNADITLSLG